MSKLALSVGALMICASVNGAPYSNPNTSYLAEGQTQQTLSSEKDQDQLLLNKVQNAVKANPDSKDYKNVTIRVSNGIVILTGTIDTTKQRQILKGRIHKIVGVKNIDDELAVKESPSSSKNP
jgi:osmotically-inducible protein OsmY